MATKTPIEKLDTSMEKLLQEYANDVTMTTKELATKIAKKGAQTLKQASAQAVGGSGKYAKGWTVTTVETRLSCSNVIHNKTPGLPHLLEKGHAKRNGGRVSGREHIKPVEEEIVEEFDEVLKNDIRRSR